MHPIVTWFGIWKVNMNCDNYLTPCSTVITAEMAEHYANKGQTRQYCLDCLKLKDGAGKGVFGRNSMSGFGEDIWKWAKANGVFDEDGFDEDPDSFLQVARKHGLVDLVQYDPDKHHDSVNNHCDLDEGDTIWYATDSGL